MKAPATVPVAVAKANLVDSLIAAQKAVAAMESAIIGVGIANTNLINAVFPGAQEDSDILPSVDRDRFYALDNAVDNILEGISIDDLRNRLYEIQVQYES